MGYTFKNLRVWNKAHKLTLNIYKATTSFPDTEKYTLARQLRRSCASIPANITEGYKKLSTKEYIRYLDISIGSLEESKYHLLLSKDLGYLTSNKYQTLQAEMSDIGKMLFGLRKLLLQKSRTT